MYSRKNVGPKIKPWTPAFTGYPCEDFPSRATQSCLLLRKDKIGSNTWPEIPWDLSLWRSVWHILLKDLCKSSATAWVAPGLLKAIAIRSGATVRRSVVHWEDLKKNWRSEKKLYFLRWSTERRLTGW